MTMELDGLDEQTQNSWIGQPTCPASSSFPNISGIDRLPKEILNAIIWLSEKEDLKSLVLVSHDWKEVAEKRLWREATIENVTRLVIGFPKENSPPPLIQGLDRLNRLGKHVRRLVVKFQADDSLESFSTVGTWVLLQSLPGLQSLKLVRVGAVPNPQQRTSDSLLVSQVCRHAPRALTSLSIRMRTIGEETILAAIRNLDHLNDLTLNCSALTESGLEQIAMSLQSRLSSLSVTGEAIGARAIAVIAKMKTLQSLQLFRKNGIPPRWVLSLPSENPFPSLRILGMDADVSELELGHWGTALEYLSSLLPAIEDVRIGGDGVLTAQGLLALSSHCGLTLKRITFHGAANDISSKVLISAMKNFPRLESFQISEISAGITPAFGVTLAKTCPRLKLFDCGSMELSAAIMEVVEAVRSHFFAAREP
ncbi:hypothetical protein HDU76_004068 [Blyttiomyces sp. JEL0837]|nr:hypothetical protein HDU76_004068 [Blyttiomyces sp. JEL0837]